MNASRKEGIIKFILEKTPRNQEFLDEKKYLSSLSDANINEIYINICSNIGEQIIKTTRK